jgi:pilus assembly protein FimV
MNRTTRISASAMLAVAALAASPAAWSLGLGDASVESYLNQPLRARIDLITSEGEDLSSVSARLASAEDYELIGASLDDLAVPVRFSIEDVDGDAFLLASSELPVNSPVVRLIVEVNWSSGRMLREYTLFLDPPVAGDQSAPLPRVDQRQAAQAPASMPPPAPAPAPEPAQHVELEPAAEPQPPSAPADARQPAPTLSPAGGAEYGPVASGETLWGIARDWSAGTGLEINKVMIAIQRENPQAFLNDNINLLKRGAVLRMPEIDDVQRISRQEAYSEVAAQEDAFYARQAGITSPATPLLSDDRMYGEPEPEPAYEAPEWAQQDAETAQGADEAAAPEPAPEAEIAAVEPEAATEEPAPEQPSLVDQLELVPPSEASELDSTYGFEESEAEGETAGATQALRESLARTEEELISQQQQNEYLAERIRELESQLEAEQQDGVADADLAAMEQRLRAEREAEQARALEQPWYARFGVWLMGLLVVVAAVVAWAIGRRSARPAGGNIEDLKGEAEEVLRVLEDQAPADRETAGEAAEEAQAAAGQPDEEASAEAAEEAAADEPQAKAARPKQSFGSHDDEASFLDTESSDPEIQLDLARAYISMGDKEAARVILEEVAANGSEEQQAEARKMLDLM